MNKIDEMIWTDFTSFFKFVKIYESHNLMKWSSQSQQSVKLTDKQTNEQDDKWYIEWQQEILWQKMMRTTYNQQKQLQKQWNLFKMKMIMMIAIMNEQNLQKNCMWCWCDEISVCFF